MTAAARGTPQETEPLDLLDGIILSLTRSTRDAADAASKALGEPALPAELELTELYGTGKPKAKTTREAGAPGGEVPATDIPADTGDQAGPLKGAGTG